MTVIIILSVLTVLIHAVSMLTFDRWVHYKTVPFYSERVPPALNGYTIAFISDTHYKSLEQFEVMAAELNSRDIDLVLLGGDHTTFMGDPGPALEAMSRIQNRDGIFGVSGNHDRIRTFYARMEEHGMTPLINSGLHIQEGFFLAGVQDLWYGTSDIAKAVSGADEDDFILLVTHNPDVTMVQDTAGISLILAGHTHGGQITFFGLYAPMLIFDGITSYGQRFRSGFAESRDGVPVLVSNGAGHSITGRDGLLSNIPRVFARPQVLLIELRSQ